MNRRAFMRLVLRGVAAGATAAVVPIKTVTARASNSQKQPNIILIMADDMGFSDIGCYGGEVHTPNLDRLAAGGLRFTQFYNAARCCPTRASLLTGLYPHQAGIGHMVGDRGYPAYQGYLNEHCVTIAEALKLGGYRTLMSGKWHVGEKRPHWPTDRGFDKYFGLISGGANYFDITKTKAKGVKRQMAMDDKPYTPPKEGFYLTDAFSDNAVTFINQYGRGPEPFFLYLPYTAPHWPLHAWPEDIAKYKGKYLKGWDALRQERRERMIRMGLIRDTWPLSPRDTTMWPWADEKNKELLDLKMAVYAAQIERMDYGIGRVLKKIEQIGARDNTLVLFLADNGGCAEGGPVGFDNRKNGLPPGGVDSYMSYGLSWANASNTPFRRYKHWVHEGGIATPLIAYWPAVIKNAGELTHQPGHIIDIMATCLDVAGITYPGTYKGHSITPPEGKSLLPIFKGRQRESHEALYWEHEGNRAVRQGRWKLVAIHGKPWELYDLEADRTELNDLAHKHPEKVEHLKSLYQSWAKRCGVLPWPIKKPRT
ncbi:MAG: arylsulfatase [Sedimentisphaerales bacterium]|nr:arylsulfatase [Sedimentisphaerales bacterium]